MPSIKHGFVAICFAFVWLPANAKPLRQQQAALAPLFSPAPGSMVAADQFELKTFQPDSDPSLLRGVIVVDPRPGQCLTITISRDRPDRVVCNKKAVSFRLAEMNAYGQIEWQVRYEGQLDPVPLQWQTPYRVAYLKSIDEERSEEPPIPTMLKSCAARPSNREITLEFFTGEVWLVSLPERDHLVHQPPPMPNLFVAEEKDKDIIGAAVKKAEQGEDPTAVSSSDMSEIGQRKAIREKWHMPPEHTYRLSADRVSPRGFSTPGIGSECRYRFKGPEQDPKTGRLECHGLPGYHFALVPLPCIHHIEIQPKS